MALAGTGCGGVGGRWTTLQGQGQDGVGGLWMALAGAGQGGGGGVGGALDGFGRERVWGCGGGWMALVGRGWGGSKLFIPPQGSNWNYVIKFNSEGAIIWAHAIAGNANFIISDNIGNIYITGLTNNYLFYDTIVLARPGYLNNMYIEGCFFFNS